MAILPVSCSTLSASRRFYFVTLLILGLITDKMYMTFYSMSMKVPTIVEEAQQALQAGYCVVIGLQSTGEVCFLFLSSVFSYGLQFLIP